MSIEPEKSPRLARLRRLAAEPAQRVPFPSVALVRVVAACADCRTPDGQSPRLVLCARHEPLWRYERVLAGLELPGGPGLSRVRRMLAAEERVVGREEGLGSRG